MRRVERSQRAEVRDQRAEGRGQRSEDRVQSSGLREMCAVVVAALLLGGCATPRPQFTDADWVSQTTTGRGCFERGDFRRGADAFARAQQRARALDDADALAVSAVNRAVCLLADGRAAEARADVAEALANARTSPARRAEVLAAAARVELALGQPDETLSRAAEALASKPPAALRGQILLAQSGAWLAKSEPATAAKVLSDGLTAGAWAKLPESIRAEWAARRGEIAASEQKPAEAAALQDESAALWKQAGRLPEMARALVAAAHQKKAAGDLPGACDRLYRAASSLWAQGLQTEAIRALDAGVVCAEELKDEDIGRRMADLYVTFKSDKRLSP